MTRYLINVGLQTTGRDITPADARAVCHAAGITIITSNVLRSDTEPTLIALVEIRPGHLGDAAFQVCDQLGQDCIAVVEVDTGSGQLIGPRAAAWGAFNPAYFLTLSGRRLSEGRREPAADAYQGHLPDGSGVQAHSAGGLYPYIIVARDTIDGLVFYFQTPSGWAGARHTSYGAAVADAVRHRGYCARRAGVAAKTSAIVARDRFDIDALVRVRKALDAGAQAVRVAFMNGEVGTVFTQEDLPAVRRKITYCM